MPGWFQNMHWRADDNRPSVIASILKPRPLWYRMLLLLVIIGAATALRFATGIVTNGAPFAFYFPAVMAVTILSGWRMGAASLLLSIVCGTFLFLLPPSTADFPTPGQWVSIGIFTLAASLQIAIAQWLRNALRELERSENRYRQLASATAGVVWTTDAEGRVHAPQSGWTELTGVTWPGYRDHAWITSIHEDDRGKVLPDVAMIAENGFHQAEFRMWTAKDDDWRWYTARTVPILDSRGHVREWVTTITDIHERRLAREQRELLIGELRHRLKNLFTVIGSLAQSSRPRNSPQVDGFLHKFTGRLHALSGAADLAIASGVNPDLQAVARATLAPFTEEESTRLRIEGPSVPLSADTGGSLALAIHELATNALKYGALSVPDGRVSLSWSSEIASDGEWVEIVWTEQGGPTPEKPIKPGFGTRVIKFAPSRERAGVVTMDYGETGLCCRIRFLKATPDSAEPTVLGKFTTR